MIISFGDYRVLDNGTVHSIGMNRAELLFDDVKINAVIIREEHEKAALNVSIRGNVASFKFINPDSLNFGPADPVFIVNNNNKGIYATIRVSVIGNFSSYSLDYTIFAGPIGEAD